MFATSLAVMPLNSPARIILVTVFSTTAWNEIWKGYKDLKESEVKRSTQKNASEVGALTLITGCAGGFIKPSTFSQRKEAQTLSHFWSSCRVSRQHLWQTLLKWVHQSKRNGPIQPGTDQLNGHLRDRVNSGKTEFSYPYNVWGQHITLHITIYMEYIITPEKKGDLIDQMPKMQAKLLCLK